MKISIIHPTVRPKQALEVKKLWHQKAVYPSRIEYLFGIDETNEEAKEILKEEKVITVPYRLGSVNKVNATANASTGDIIVCATDDVYPCKFWDSLVVDAVGDVTKEVYLACEDGHAIFSRPDLLHGMIFTRPYLNKRGWILNPEFFHIYADDFLTAMVLKDGVLKIAPHILFEHKSPFHGNAPFDIHYERCNTPEQYQIGEDIFKRECEKFGLERNTKAIYS